MLREPAGSSVAKDLREAGPDLVRGLHASFLSNGVHDREHVFRGDLVERPIAKLCDGDIHLPRELGHRAVGSTASLAQHHIVPSDLPPGRLGRGGFGGFDRLSTFLSLVGVDSAPQRRLDLGGLKARVDQADLWVLANQRRALLAGAAVGESEELPARGHHIEEESAAIGAAQAFPLRFERLDLRIGEGHGALRCPTIR